MGSLTYFIYFMIFSFTLSVRAQEFRKQPNFVGRPQEEEQVLKDSIEQDARRIEEEKKRLQLIVASQKTKFEKIKERHLSSQLIDELKKSKLEKEQALETLQKNNPLIPKPDF